MEDVVVGVLALVAGLFFCFRGYVALRLVIPVWGAFAGFAAGTGLVAAVTGDGFLATTLAWIVGIGVALLFAVLAYAYYALAVIITMGAVGFSLGTALMVALGARWTWLIVLVGVVAGVLLAVVAIVADLPLLVLVLLSALAGASAAISGLMLLTGAVETADFTSRAVTETVEDGWGWYVAYVVLAVVGIGSQLGGADREAASLRQSWDGAPPRQPR